MTAMLVTRPLPDGEETAARLSGIGFDPVLAPMLSFFVMPAALPTAAEISALVFTSANAVRALEEMGVLPTYLELPAFAVGDRTAAAARAAGFAIVTSADGDAEALAALLGQHRFERPLFYPCPKAPARDLQAMAANWQVEIMPVPVYEMRAETKLPEDVELEIESGRLCAGMFYSRRTSETFVDLCAKKISRQAKAGFSALCLSANVAAPLLNSGYPRIALADFPSEEAMIALALSFSRGQIKP